MAVDPYKVLADAYAERTKAINESNNQQIAEKQQREQQAKQNLVNSNRGVYTTFRQETNPYGSFASQNNFSSGVSDYYRNAAYGTMLKGIGSNQYNYNDAINNSNTLWNNWVAEKAGLASDALEGYNDAVIAQQNADQKRKDEQEAAAQAQANWEAEQAYIKEQDEKDRERQDRLDKEAKEQQDKENSWAERELALKEGASTGSGGGGTSSSRKSSNDSPTDLTVPNANPSPTGDQRKDPSQNSKENTSDNYANKVVRSYYEPSSVPGYQYRIFVYNDGSTSKVMVKKK